MVDYISNALVHLHDYVDRNVLAFIIFKFIYKNLNFWIDFKTIIQRYNLIMEKMVDQNFKVPYSKLNPIYCAISVIISL